jgi:RimJ/RimL family protein N-acetyltransferase
MSTSLSPEFIPPGTPCPHPPALLPSATTSISSPLFPGITLVPLQKSHTTSLYANLCTTPENNQKIWLYIPRGPFFTHEDYEKLIEDAIPTEENVRERGYLTYAVISSSPEHQSSVEASDGKEEGIAIALIRLLALSPPNLSVEIGMVLFPLSLQRTRFSTLIFYLLINHVVSELGYERVEWKANVLNKASVRCAERLGFRYEGLFRRHWVVKGVWYV